MKIQTTVDIEYTVELNKKKTGKIQGVIQNSVFSPQGFGANYMYLDSNGLPIHQAGFQIDNAATNALHEQLKGDIPEGLSFTDHMQHMFYLGFILQMAETFNIAPNQIEIIND